MILVTGATGNVGAEVLRQLAEGGHPVRGLTRRPPDRAGPVELVAGDLTRPDSLRAAARGVNAVFLLAGQPDPPGLLAALRSAGVERVVLLSSGAVVGGDLDNYVVRYNVVSEAAVRDSGLQWTVLRPSGFMSNALAWAEQLGRSDVVQEPFAAVPVAVVDPADIGAVAVLALTADGHAGRSYRLTGPQALTPADRLQVLGEVLGRRLRLDPEPDAVARSRMAATMPPDVVEAFFRFFVAGEYDDSRVTPTVADLLDRAPRTFADWARAHTAAFPR